MSSEPTNEGTERLAASDLSLSEFLRDSLPEVLKAFDASTLTELDVKYGDVQFTLRRAVGGSSVTIAGPPPIAPPVVKEQEPEGYVVTAQMVGTFYLAPAPGKPPMVQEGDLVEKGQVIGIIEAMKVMNELESEVTGRVIRILAKNQQPVEFGQPLMVIAPE